MEFVNESSDVIKITKYIIDNTFILVKKNKVDSAKIVLINDLIHLEMNNCIYTINNMVLYKKFVEKISYKYKIILPYIPKSNNEDIIKKLINYYYKNCFVTIIIKEKEINIF